MSDELKPVCCGCGGKVEVYTQPLFGCYVMCGNCGMRTRLFINRAKAIEAWNRAMRRAKVDILPNTSEDKGEMPFCPSCCDELEWDE